MKKNSRIFIAGHKGMVGSAIKRELQLNGYDNFILKTKNELDLTNQKKVNNFFKKEKPEYVFLAAAKVGGILANDTYRAEFIYSNLIIQTNVIQAAHEHRTKKLLFLGSSCIYPRDSQQPITETALLTGPLEPTNEMYAIAKIAGLKMCQAYRDQYGSNFISVMPTNLYGPNDTYDLKNAHVLPALLRKFHEAKSAKASTVTIWGTGKPRREFMYVDDMARACISLMKTYNQRETINIGTGQDVSIKELAQIIAKVTDFQGQLVFDTSKPDGTPRKLLDISKLSALNFKPQVTLEEGIAYTYQDFLKHYHA